MVSYNRRPERVHKAFRRRKVSVKKNCAYCDRSLEKPTSPSGLAYTNDHVIPKSMGGVRTVPCCKACNQIKGDMMPPEWSRFRKENPQWWKLWKGKPNV